MIEISEGVANHLDNLNEFNELLNGELSSLGEIFVDDDSRLSELSTQRKETKNLILETAVLGETLSGKSIKVDSTVAVDTELIVNVNRQINDLRKSIFGQTKKPESIRKKLLEKQSLFEDDIKKMLAQIEEWSTKIKAFDKIDIDDDDKDLLAKHSASILESNRLDNEIELLSTQIGILEEELE